MWSVIRKPALLGAMFVLVAVGSARAAVVEVKVPFPFLVQGRTLPAGEYRVESDDMNPSVLIIRGEKGTRAGLIVLTTRVAGDDPAGEKPALTFTRHEMQYQLTDVWEAGGQGRQIERP